jgi:3-oxo-4,17-pregnadiene-20-carboxyl-CoA hydratase alpha subunit
MPSSAIPVANFDTKPFWDGCAAGTLLLQQCSACRAYRHPPSPICANCLGDRHAWVPASGRGTVYTFVVVREARRGWDKAVPYVLAVVELEEGPRILTDLVNLAPEDVRIGMPVEVTFAELDGTTKLPLFQPR